MRAIKSQGGLSRGRGVTDDVLLKWIICTPTCSRGIQSLESFTGSMSSTTEQHVELRDSRITRDNVDKKKFVTWLQQHNPFISAVVTLSVYLRD